MRNTFLLGLFVLFFVIPNQAFSIAKDKKVIAYDSTLIRIEKQISILAKQLYETRRNDAKSMEISEEISALFQTAFEKPEAFEYPFDSVYPVGKVKAEKGEFQIFTWNIILNTGKCKHYGFLSYQNKSLQKSYVLTDNSDKIEEVLSASLSAEKWFGANYYQIVEAKNQSGTHYILLGWKGNDLHSTKKVIETLYFTESGKPKFGKSLIKVERKKIKRLVFEYSRMADMMLKYDEEFDLVVFDHLSPTSGVEAGDFQFYGPDLSYDALKYNGEFWEYLSAIDYKKVSGKRRKKR